METIIKNRVANSGLITLDLSTYIPDEIIIFDIKPLLFQELILKEKEFREKLKSIDFSIYKDQFLCLANSSDAIVPMWAYMLIGSNLTPHTSYQFVGSLAEAEKYFTMQLIERIPVEKFKDARLIIKGCSDKKVISETAYLAITKHLLPYVKTLMYGEPCSTVPVFKRKVV